MFFVFSKLLLIFILPLTWILALLIASLIIKNTKIRFRLVTISVVLLLLYSNPFLFHAFAHAWDIQSVPLVKKTPYSCAIVLGGFAAQNNKKVGFFNGAEDRFIEGLKLIVTHKASHILISGGNGNLIPDSFHEADWVRTQLQEFNVPDSFILIEDQSRNTIENAAFTKPVLIQNHLKPPYILVTSAFHMRRSLGIFKKIGIDVVPYPCDFIVGGEKFSIREFIPDAGVLVNWNIYIKEVIGNVVNFFR